MGFTGSILRTMESEVEQSLEHESKMVVAPNSGYLFKGPSNKDYITCGSIWGSLYFRKLPNGLVQRFIGIVAYRGLDTCWNTTLDMLYHTILLSEVCKQFRHFN